MSAQLLAISPHYKAVTPKQQSVTTTAAQIPQLAATDAVKGTPDNIFVQALSTNTGIITISNTASVTAGGAGIELPAGANINLPTHNAGEWYAIASAGTQKLNVTYAGGPL